MKSKRVGKIYGVNKKQKIISFIVSSLVVLLFVTFSFTYTPNDKLVKVNLLKVVGNTIIIGNNCTAIVADTSPERARNILLGMEGIIPERPTTHDTIVQILNAYNLTVEKVVLERYDGRYYYADLWIYGKDKKIKLDIMPSDGIAIAVRTNSPIYINKTLLDEVGEKVC